jgi:DNA polymerase (family 10)
VVVVDDPIAAEASLASIPEFSDVTRPRSRRLVGLFRDATVDIRIAAPDDYGTTLFHGTGSVAHVRDIVARGLGTRKHATEERLYSSVGLGFIPPELRHSTGEIEAAESRTLPKLVELSNIRGDLHMHSVYSDGRDSIATMIAAGHALGYGYVAITDHSWGAAAARTLAVDAIGRQRDEIDRLRQQYPQMAILHGVEVDILPDGRLDFNDSVLEQFDIVLASLHESAGHSRARLTRRTLQAIRHPLVNVLCHPANRLVGRFPGYPLDFEAIYAAAAETGTALEVDGAPSHLDLDGEHARAAVAAGATLAVDSDCHRADALGRQMRFGIGTARRGWVTPDKVLNTRSLPQVLAFIAAKRS